MATVTTDPDSDLAILSRLIRPKRHGLSASAARAILKIDFEASDRERMNVLAEKARSGTLTPQERAAIDNYERVGHLLDLIHAKARQSLRKRKGAAPRRTMNEALVRLVWERARSRCEYCQLPQALTRLPCQIDHVIAVKHHGSHRASNLALSCFACNNHKGPNIAGIDPVSRKIAPLYNPRRHKWGRHFRWEGPVLCGLTAIGRATVAVLEINLPYRVALRQALIEGGVFPARD